MPRDERRNERPVADDVIAALRKHVTPGKAEILQRFFKTGPGEYGTGDRFLGVLVPDQRRIARLYRNLLLSEVQKLLKSPIHEARLTALFILVQQFEKGTAGDQEKIYRLYVKNLDRVNNWDLVDSSAPRIAGAWLESRSRAQLRQWARSESIWERRIAMLATHRYIKNNDFSDALTIAGILLEDDHDLVHKAVGWMLREIGKQNPTVEKSFLDRHCGKIPRTTLRYAIERFPEIERKRYLRRC